MGVLQEERNKLFLDIHSGKKPARVPIQMMVDVSAALEYFKYSVKRDLYSAQKCFEAADKMSGLLEVDSAPVAPRGPQGEGAVLRYVDSKFMVPSTEGFFQHPDFAPMKFEEYEEYIKNPYDFTLKKLHPRTYGIFNDGYPELAYIRIRIAKQVGASLFAGMGEKIKEKYQFDNVMSTAAGMTAPFDHIADFVRSYSTMLIDMKRAPQLVLDACEATANYMIKQVKSLPKPAPGKVTIISVPLHMAPSMSTKDVEKFYWPTFVKLMQAMVDNGFIPDIFFEADWSRHMHLMQELPKGGPIVARFEDTKRELIKKYVPSRVIIKHCYPFMTLKTGTKQEAVDEAKKVIDDLAGNGTYIFSPNKSFLRAGDINIENMQAVIKCVQEYGKY